MFICIARVNARGFGGKYVENSPGKGVICSKGSARGVVAPREGSDAAMHKYSGLLA